MKRLKRVYKKAVPFIIIIPLLFHWIPVSATEPSSNVWLHVIEVDPDVRISVTVPMAFGFVVNGTRDTSSSTKIAVDEGTLMLPNFTVDVTNSAANNGNYSLQMYSQSELTIKNYSTYMDPDLTENPSQDPTIRAGLPVTLDAYVASSGYDNDTKTDDPQERAYWEAVTEEPEEVAGDFKKYQVSLIMEDQSVHTFSEEGLDDMENYIFMDQSMELEKPQEDYGYTKSGLARAPSILKMNLDVKVGGYRGQYTQVEESVKAGTIYWLVSVDFAP